MRVFVTGGSGLTGPAVVSDLISAGHTVVGLARSDASAARLETLGAGVRRGDLDDLDGLRAGAERSEGVLHMAFGGDFSDTDDMARRDTAAITALGEGLTGSGKPLVITSGTFAMAAGSVSREQDAPDPTSAAHFRIPGEQACEAGPMLGNAFVAGAYAIDAPASSARTRSLLGWDPTHPTLLEELEHGDYFDAPAKDYFAAG